MNEIVYAPIIIPTLCRHKHFKNQVESLKKNAWAKYTDVYIGLDYPAKAEHWDGYKKICEYLDNGDFSVFKSFNVIRREKNCGPDQNTQLLLNDLFKRYDRWILAEDDMIFSQNFLEYMDKCLALYEDNDDVIAINGYSYPIDWVSEKDANIIFQSSICITWGVGYWKEKYDKLVEYLSDGYLTKTFDKNFKTGKLDKMIKSRRGAYIGGSLGGRKSSYVNKICDYSLGLYLAIEDKYVVTPVISKVRNMGMDGSGVNQKKVKRKNNKNSWTLDYNNQAIDTNERFEPKPDKYIYRKENKELLDKFSAKSLGFRIATTVMITAYRIMGIKGYKFIVKKLAKLLGLVKKDFFNDVTFEYLEEYNG